MWEKEIRRARKDNFKSQSAIVKLQEELKSSRQSAKAALADYEKEKERSVNREQEAFSARYQLVTVQEELAQLQDKIKLVEQERDALRTIAKNEEIARIAAEGQLPLPASTDDDEFASPKKARRSLNPVTILSSAASEEELDDIRLLLQWEQQRADRAHDRVEFLEAECRLNCCTSRAALQASSQSSVPVVTAATLEARRTNTIFIPAEGIFRTVSPAPEESPWISPAKKNLSPIFPPEVSQATPSHSQHEDSHAHDTRVFARTPSCEPPAPAVVHDTRTSLLSLLNAPHSPSFPDNEDLSEGPEDEQEEEEGEGEEAVIASDPSPSPAHKIFPDDSCRPIPIFTTICTTTQIPLANPPDLTPQPATVVPNALGPTMSREEALAQIRERRGRARSLAQGTMTPRKQMVEGTERRDISAPAIRSGTVRGRLASRTK